MVRQSKEEKGLLVERCDLLNTSSNSKKKRGGDLRMTPGIEMGNGESDAEREN